MTAELEGRASLPAWGPPAGVVCRCWHAHPSGPCGFPGCPCPAFRLSLFSLLLVLRRLFP